jgi:ribosomal protein S18 acetylase RimI-like enzyme
MTEEKGFDEFPIAEAADVAYGEVDGQPMISLTFYGDVSKKLLIARVGFGREAARSLAQGLDDAAFKATMGLRPAVDVDPTAPARPIPEPTALGVKNDVEIVKIQAVDDGLLSDVQRLHSQVSSSSAPTFNELAAVVAGPGTTLLVARERTESRSIKGMLTVVTFRILSGLRVRIEDVVVDEASRRLGIGEALSVAAVEYARSLGARNVELTSRPSRDAANKLYIKLGFERRNTNVYNLTL